jgi:hypothetical protein
MATNATHAEPLVVPIGHYVGTFVPPSGSPDHHEQVRIGADVRDLDPEQFRIWGLAHGLLDRVDAGSPPWTRSALLAAAAEAGIAGAEQVTGALLADGTLMEVTADDAVGFARTHRMVPLMLGLGNTPEEPWLYAVGFPDQPIVKMVGVLYDLWGWSHMDNDMWTACHGAGRLATRAGVTDPDQTDPQKLLSGLVESLHTLLAPNAVYLDLRRAG